MTLERELAKGKNKERTGRFLFIVLLLSILITSKNVLARDPSFSWNASTDDPPVDGYFLYYKIGNPGNSLTDYDGTDASGNNPSPVEISGAETSSYILLNLLDTERYSFVLTSYRGASESSPTAAITLEPVVSNTPPSATNATIDVVENDIYSGQLTGDDPDGDSLTFQIVGASSKGVVNITDSSTGAFTYLADNGQSGTDSFTFRVNDGVVNSNTATVTINIAASNEAPSANNSAFSLNEDTPSSGQLSATDPDGDSLTYSIVNQGSKGTVAITNISSGNYTYTPNNNVNGSDSFTFRVNDGTVNSATATVSVTITAVNDPPTANSSSLTTSENTAKNGQLTGNDPDGDALTYSILNQGSKGSVVITNTSNGNFTYTPNANANGSDSFTFRVNDGIVNSAAATVNVTISNVNVAPVASNASETTSVNTPVTGLFPASDQDGDNLTYSIVSNGSKGSATITNQATGEYTYTPQADVTGNDSFTYKVNDGALDSNIATINVTISDEETITVVFGDTPGADFPGTIKDTYANIDTEINAGLETLRTHSWSSPSPHKVANTIILKADLNSIPSYATIVEARLFLYQTGNYGESEYSNSVHKIIGKNPVISQVNGYNAFNGEPWSPVPAGTTYNDIPLGIADIAAMEDQILLDNQGGYRSRSITAMAQEWVSAPTINFGLLIMGEETTGETGRSFAATENQTAAMRPKLEISYTLTPPAPSLINIEEIK